MSEDTAPDLALARRRVRLLGVFFAAALAGLGLRLAGLALSDDEVAAISAPALANALPTARRAEIVDRNGILLATDYPKVSIFADPVEVLDVESAARQLAAVLSGMDAADVREKLSRPRRFVWIKRHVSDAEQRAVIRLGLPGIRFRTELHRVYPQRSLAAHVVGYVGVENQGLAGIERSFEQRLTAAQSLHEPLALTLDVRVQEVVRSELMAAVGRFQAQGASGLVLDAGSGEILAAVSLPDFDPNHYQRAHEFARFNRNTQGVYELGSIFKLYTVAMALDAGAVEITGGLDAREPFQLGRHKIRDFHAHKRWLSVPEIIAFSSNIGAAKMAQALGAETQRAYLQRLGMLDKHPIRLPEVGTPQLPEPWRPINTVTAGYGHGIAVSPLQAADALAALVCAAPRERAHIVAEEAPGLVQQPPVDPAVSRMLRWLMWLVVREGTGTLARVPGYLVGGKTGSADQAGPGGYRQNAVLSSFIAAFPMQAPRYVVLITLDEPQGDAATQYQAQAGWTAAPTVGRIVSRIGPLLGLPPAPAEAEARFVRQLAIGEAFNGRLRRSEPSFAVAPGVEWSAPDEETASCGCRPCSNLT